MAKKKTSSPPKNKKIYMCSCCGKEYTTLERNFPANKQSPFYKANDGYLPICKRCMDDFEKKYTELFDGNNDEAIKRLCMYWHIYYEPSLLKASEKVPLTASRINSYISKANLKQYRGKTYDTYLEQHESNKPVQNEDFEVTEVKGTVWGENDLQNKNFVINSIGYDCFDDASYLDEDRKFLFNTLADYLTDDVRDDPHKVQSVIEVVKTTLQINVINKTLNYELSRPNPEDSKINKLAETKSKFISSVSKMADENGISAKGNCKQVKGSNTLSLKIKKMTEDDYEPIKVNLYDIKTCEAMKQIADLSNQSIMDQLSMDANEYTDVIKMQREMIAKLESEKEACKEELRTTKNENTRLEVELEDCKKIISEQELGV